MSRSIELAETEPESELAEDALSADEINAALDALPDGALVRLGRVARRFASGRSIAADDLLQESVVRALDGVRKCPRSVSIMAFLVGVMRSIVSASSKALRTDPLALQPPASEDEEDDSFAHLKGEARDPLRHLIGREDIDRMLAELVDLFQDDQMAGLVLLGVCQEMEPEEIRADLKLDETAYATIRRRIRRRIDRRYPNGWEL